MTAHSHTNQHIAEVSCILLAFSPLLFIPITQNFYDTNKWMLLILVAIGMLILWIISSAKTGSFTISTSPVTIGFGALAVASLISLAFGSTNRIDALLNPLGPITWVSLTFVTIFTPMLIRKETETNVRWVLYGASATVALIALYAAFGVGKIMFPAGNFLADPLFTPTGTTTASIGLFAIMLPLAIADAASAAKEKRETALAFLIIIALIETVGFGVSLWQIIPKISTNFLPIGAAWSIMLETMKNTKQAIVGVGAENFITAFTAGRPLALNLTPIWNGRFVLSSNMLFHLITTYGLLGCIAVILLLKGLLAKTKSLFTGSLIVGMITFLLIPPSITILIIIALIAALVPGQKTVTMKSPFNTRLWLGIPVTVLLTLATLFTLYWVGKAYWADMLITQSYAYAQKNNGTQTYNLQVKAIETLPQATNYHILLSQTTMSMALSLASSINSTETNQNKQSDQQLISQLIQQSIREAKLAVSLNPQNVTTWENIAQLYDQLTGIAQGADTFSISAYNQTIQMDPSNPTLHLELGALLVRLANYTQAITQFQQAIALKPNYTNAYYNLSNAYKLNKDITQAITTMEQTVSLVDKTSSDYRVATQALADLKKSAPGIPTTTKIEQNPSTKIPILRTPTPSIQTTPTITF